MSLLFFLLGITDVEIGSNILQGEQLNDSRVLTHNKAGGTNMMMPVPTFGTEMCQILGCNCGVKKKWIN